MLISIILILAITGFFLSVKYVIQMSRVDNLQWPAEMPYYTFKKLVFGYLKSKGWTITYNVNEIRYDCKAEKIDKSIFIALFPSAIGISSGRLTDLRELRKTVGYSRAVICVTADVQLTEILLEAAKKKIHVIHYTKLSELESLEPIK